MSGIEDIERLKNLTLERLDSLDLCKYKGSVSKLLGLTNAKVMLVHPIGIKK